MFTWLEIPGPLPAINLASISISDFTKITKLLRAMVADTNADLSAFEGSERPGKRGSKADRKTASPRAEHGAIKETVVSLLNGAGKEGMSVKNTTANAGSEEYECSCVVLHRQQEDQRDQETREIGKLLD